MYFLWFSIEILTVMHIQIDTLETIPGIIEDFEYTLNQLKRTYKLNKIIKI